jgi:hypothetical protein
MKAIQRNRVRLSLEALEDRWAPATLTVTPNGLPWVEPDTWPITQEITAAAKPGLTTAQAHTGGVVKWSLASVPW